MSQEYDKQENLRNQIKRTYRDETGTRLRVIGVSGFENFWMNYYGIKANCNGQMGIALWHGVWSLGIWGVWQLVSAKDLIVKLSLSPGLVQDLFAHLGVSINANKYAKKKTEHLSQSSS